MMKINIYYGGRGLLEDPALYVLNKITSVLEELRVEVNRYNLFEDKQGISTLTRTLKECDGVILAITVEWLGIGGLMQQFLDDCWLYADKENLSRLYMLPVVTATTYGERDAEFQLCKAWEMLGGIPVNGLSAYVENHIDFETNPDYALLIERKAEDLYRAINKKIQTLPSSMNAVKQNVLKSSSIELTPQESEQLSMYVSDNTYVKRQKEDIEELAQMFKQMLGTSIEETPQEFIPSFTKNFHPLEDFHAVYSIIMADTNRTLVIEVNADSLNCHYEQEPPAEADIAAKTTRSTVEDIVTGQMNFQRAFMSGLLTAKGDFKTLRTFDTIFQFPQA